ncbi:MAG: DUF882 domain-containing protein [Candidatus Eremiobacteraeota bacterium]|nr:DUF882 domain-containing protein [Candidatus Eremiobacteraeota bacterium]
MKKKMLSRNFSRDELACPCCGRIGRYPKRLKYLLSCLERLTEIAGQKPVITSCYRCPRHNAEVGGVPNSYHCQDMAVDLWIRGKTLNQIARYARKAGFTGIGRYWGKGFVHCDTGPQRTWEE